MLDAGRYFPALSCDADGIWVAEEHRAVSYPDSGHSGCRAVEDGSFWFKHRNQCIVAAVRRHLPIDQGPVFDIGGGNGYVARGLTDVGYEVVLVEPGIDGARNARRRGLANVVCATTETAGFPVGSIPAVGLFDVIEHIAEDREFLVGLARLMTPGGRLFVTVPAYQWLWSQEDIDAGHHRRYSQRSIARLMERSGFDIEFVTYFFRPLPLPILLLRSFPYRAGLRRDGRDAGKVARDHAVGTGSVTSLIERLLASEQTNISEGRSMLFGGSLLLVARVSGQFGC